MMDSSPNNSGTSVPDKAEKFDAVYQQECREIRERRAVQSYAPGANGNPNDDSPPESLVGLALSGGGIRSATFSLGVLQELHRLKLLRIFDYLSTVSGGGYVGGWWSAWLTREQVNSQTDEEGLEEDFTLRDAHDIRNPGNLAYKLRESLDPAVVKLREGFSGETKNLLKEYKDHCLPSTALINAMVDELNLAIKRKILTGANGSETESGRKAKRGEGSTFGDHSLWANRLRLEKLFPYEIKGLFPSREKLELERPTNGSPKAEQGKGESSRNAWRDPIHHLRLYANYLTPRRGMFSADTWRAVSTISRNLILTWLIILPLLTGVMLLGQLYFLLHPSIGSRLFESGGSASAIELLTAVLPLTFAFLGWIGVMGIAWLFCNRDKSTATDVVIQATCLFAVVALAISGVTVVTGQSVLELVGAAINTTSRLWILIGWTLVAVVLLAVVSWRPNVATLQKDDPETIARWRTEVRRNRIGRVHAWLLLLLILLSTALLLSGLSHKTAHLFQFKGITGIPLALLPVFSALAGSIFTALKATPAGGGDQRQSREPSFISRFIFATTPGLVVTVLAVSVAWLGHNLLEYIWINEGHRVESFLIVSALYGVSLCLALAIYEMKWPATFKRSMALLVLLCLLIVNVSWGALASVRYILLTTEAQTRLLLLLFSMIVGLTALAIAFKNIALREKWRQYLTDKALKKKVGKGLLYAFWFGCVVVLVGVGFILSIISSHEKGKDFIVDPTGVPLGLAALAGSLILFRLAVARKGNERFFELRWFKDKAFGEKPEALWLLASVCLALPIAVSSWVHAFWENDLQASLPLILFPLMLALLPGCLIALRILAIQIRQALDAGSGKQSILDWVLDKFPRAAARKQTAFKVVAGVGLAAAVVAGYAVRNVTEVSNFSLQSFGVPFNVMLIALFVTFAAVVALFKSAVYQIPLKETKGKSHPKHGRARPSKLQNQGVIWLLALICITLAIWIGYLTSIWSEHIRESPIGLSLASVALPGMVACLTLTAFEMLWGVGDNRRSVLLIAAVYLSLSAMFLVLKGPWDTEWLQAQAFVKPVLIVFGLLAAALVWVVALGWMIDPNTVSMHQFYKARLVRAYLGASNPRRLKEHKEITEAVAGDDVPLSSLKNCERGAPYHLINTTLNLVAGRDLATAQRSASSFVLAKNHCGSHRTMYRPTKFYQEGRLSLGTAVATSGAAVSPSMGSKKPTAALAMLLTFLNVRLGYWSPTPCGENWKMSQPRLWPFYLLREFLSQTNDVSSYCYLTDGGHFDNTGLYSLVERGCRYIVLVDCGADPQPSCFQDLGEAIRRCRIDFGTEVTLQLDPLIETKEQKPTQYFSVGEVTYSKRHADSLGWKPEIKKNGKVDETWLKGTIIYFKPSILEKETADVRQYAIENKNFPHQSTTNQWFGEAQFESYRRLGQSSAEAAFEELSSVKRMKKKVVISPKDIKAVFVEASKRFNPKPETPKRVRTKKVKSRPEGGAGAQSAEASSDASRPVLTGDALDRERALPPT